MSYEEAIQHFTTCTVNTAKSKVEKLLSHLKAGDKVVEWDETSRCKRCK